jgi:hypothetical protein
MTDTNFYQGFIEYANNHLDNEYTDTLDLYDDLYEIYEYYFTTLNLSLEQANQIICSWGIVYAIEAYENKYGGIEKTEHDIAHFLLKEEIDHEDFLHKLRTDS